MRWRAISARPGPYRWRSASLITGATAGWLSTRPSYPRLPMYHVLSSESSAASNALQRVVENNVSTDFQRAKAQSFLTSQSS